MASTMSIKPGDVLFTSTPQGLLFGEKAPPNQRHWLQPGDEAVSDLEDLGEHHVQLSDHQRETRSKATNEAPQKFATVDRLAALNHLLPICFNGLRE